MDGSISKCWRFLTTMSSQEQIMSLAYAINVLQLPALQHRSYSEKTGRWSLLKAPEKKKGGDPTRFNEVSKATCLQKSKKQEMYLQKQRRTVLSWWAHVSGKKASCLNKSKKWLTTVRYLQCKHEGLTGTRAVNKRTLRLNRTNTSTQPSYKTASRWIRTRRILLGTSWRRTRKNQLLAVLPIWRLGLEANCFLKWQRVIFTNQKNEKNTA